MASIRTELQKKAQNELLQHAFFRWESALIVALTILLTFLGPSPLGLSRALVWPILGLIGLGAIIYTSLNDAENNAKVLLDAFQHQFDISAIRDQNLRDDILNALEYQRRIEDQLQGMRKTLVRERMEDTAGRVSDWINNVYQLALRIDTYRQDDLIEREMRTLPREIDQLEATYKLEGNSELRMQQEQVIDSKRKHLQSISELDTRMRQAELQIEQSITSLATIYSQVQLVDAQSVNSSRAERLQSDIQDQVDRLNDLVDSINEVYRYGD
ncbi:MAG: hypothetical protein AAF702_25845 [Chloroflexota bacterium]